MKSLRFSDCDLLIYLRHLSLYSEVAVFLTPKEFSDLVNFFEHLELIELEGDL